MRILLTGSITGGHLTPLKAIKDKIKELKPKKKVELYLITNKQEAQKEILDSLDGVKVYKIPCGKFRRSGSIKNFLDMFKTFFGFLRSFWVLFVVMPDVIFARGSSVSVPVGIVAWIYRIPLIIHEADLSPSLTNRILAPFAKYIIVTFDKSKEYFNPKKVLAYGTPVRKMIFQGNRERGFKNWELDPKKKTIYVTGGSQGSQIINRAIVSSLQKLLPKYQIIFQCGAGNLKQTEQMINEIDLRGMRQNLKLVGFLKEDLLADTFRMADLVISRAGATTIVELASLKKAMILVPLESPVTRGDQVENAFYMQENQAAIVLAQSNLSASLVMQTLTDLFETSQGEEKLKSIAENAFNLIKKDADTKIAEKILEEV